METKRYRVAVSGSETGAFTLDELCDQWRTGRIGADALYLQEPANKWRPIARIVEPRIQAGEAAKRAAAVAVARQMPPPRTNYAAQEKARPAAPAAPRLSANGALLVKPQKSRGIYIILGVLLGGLGLHNFYAGHLGRGAGQLVLTILAVVLWLPLAAVAMAVWVIAELCLETTDGAGDPLA